jgi:hypothetical protein
LYCWPTFCVLIPVLKSTLQEVNGEGEDEQENAINFPVFPQVDQPADEVLQPDNEFKKLKLMLEGEFSETLEAAPKISPAQLFLNSLNLINHYNLNHSQSEGIMKLINSIFQENILPNSRHLLDKVLKSACGSHYHFLCNKCQHYLGEKDYEKIRSVQCDVCNTVNEIGNLSNSIFFVLFDIPPQLEVLFNIKKIRNALKDPLDLVNIDDNGPIRDLYDGSVYQKFAKNLPIERSFRHVSCCFSFDGSPLFKTNHKEIWPIFVNVLELPPRMRGHNLMIAGLWFGRKRPVTDVFLQLFIEHMNGLSINGFRIKVANEEWKMKAYLLGSCCDAPARASVQSVHQHNGRAGM